MKRCKCKFLVVSLLLMSGSISAGYTLRDNTSGGDQLAPWASHFSGASGRGDVGANRGNNRVDGSSFTATSNRAGCTSLTTSSRPAAGPPLANTNKPPLTDRIRIDALVWPDHVAVSRHSARAGGPEGKVTDALP